MNIFPGTTSTIIILAFLVSATTMAQAPDGANGVHGSTILVLTRFREGVDVNVTDAAVTTICDELKITGFNVMRLAPVEDAMPNLKQMIGDAFDRHHASTAVVISQTSPTDGTVMLFGKNGLDEVTNLDSEYVEFPMDRDKAEVVAFKVSEKVALLHNGMRSSVSNSPVDISPPGGPAVEKSAPADPEKAPQKAAKKRSVETVRHKWGLYLGIAGEVLPLDVVLGGVRLGARWLPHRLWLFDLELLLYPVGNRIEGVTASASLGDAGVRMRIAHAIPLRRYISATIGVFAGVGLYWVYKGTIDSANAPLLGFRGGTSRYFNVGGSGEISWKLSEGFQMPLRIGVGARFPGLNIYFEDLDNGELVANRHATLGLLMIDVSLGVRVTF